MIDRGGRVIRHYAKSWPKYSGDDVFPVPDPWGRSPENAYNFHHFPDGLYTGEYGKLLQHIIRKTR